MISHCLLVMGFANRHVEETFLVQRLICGLKSSVSHFQDEKNKTQFKLHWQLS